MAPDEVISAFQHRIEEVGGGVKICVTRSHTFNTDSFLLSWFAQPKSRELACDLCSGCGIVPLLWFRRENHPQKAYALDIQEQAFRQMEMSARLSGLEDSFTPLWGDLRELPEELPKGRFDLVTCNPPYKAANTGLLSREDADRTARHETFCALEDVVRASARLLRFGGRLCICQLPERLVDVLTAMREGGIEPKRVRFAQGHPEKAPWLVLVEGKLGSKPFLQVEKPLILRENGAPTPEMKRIYDMYGFVGDIE